MKDECITNYKEIAIRQTKLENLKNIARMIITCAIEDADLEFFEDDFNRWKELYDKRKRKKLRLYPSDYRKEFKFKQIYKESLFDIIGFKVHISDIPHEYIEEREKFENNCMKDLMKITSYKKETLLNIAKEHSWKIGINYTPKTIFDL